VAAPAPRLTGGALAVAVLLAAGGGIAARAVGDAARNARTTGAARAANASTRAFDATLEGLHRSVDQLALLAPALAKNPALPAPQVVDLAKNGSIAGVLLVPTGSGAPLPVTGRVPSTVDLAGLAVRMRSALELTRDTGEPHAAVVVDTVTIAVPVYTGADVTTADRRVNLTSWLVALVDPHALVGRVSGETEAATLSIAGTMVTPDVPREPWTVTHAQTLFGQSWQVVVTPRMEGGAGPIAGIVLALGLLGSFGALVVGRRSSRQVAHAVASTDALERETRTIAEVGPLLQQSLDLAEVLPAVAVRLSDEFVLDGFAVELLGEHGTLVDVFAVGRRHHPGEPVPIVGSEGVPAGTEVGLPLLRAGRTIGRLRLATREALAPTQVDALRAAADLIAVATYNVELYEREQGTVRRLQEVDRLKDAFLGTISHELRTPITAIGGFARMLNERYDDLTEEQRRDFLRRIGRNSASLGMLVDDLLDFARLERQALQTHVSPLPLDSVVAGFISQVVPALGDHEVKADLEKGVMAMADPRAIERVLANLLTNAAKFSPPGSPIEVSLHAVDAFAEVCVTDHGPGIAEEDRLRVFTRFYRGDSDVARSTRGAGIGLSVVHELVTQMGGEVEVRPREPHGTTMVVRLPLVESMTPAQRKKKAGVVPARST